MDGQGDYFDSYDNINVHNLMLRDDLRVAKYREAILGSKDLFKDKIVLDVGSGTGLLSLFSAQAGAKHVYAIEASKGIFTLSKEIIKANRLQDKITIVNGEVEKIELPDGVKQVDIIVSEWMGMYLLHESMLNSVIFARDKWLRKDGAGLMYPNIAYLYVCPVEMTSYLNENLSYWTSYYGLNYEPLMKVYRQLLLEKPVIETITRDQLIDDEKLLASFDLCTIGIRDLETIQSYNLEFVANRACNLHGFAMWFDVLFKADNDEIITLSTSPDEKPTHWKQTVTFLPEALNSFIKADSNDQKSVLSLNEDAEFECYVILNQSDDNPRNYEIDIGVDMKSDQADTSKNMEGVEMQKEDEGNIYDSAEDDDDDDDEDDEEEHSIPCDCSRIKCVLIKATLEKYENDGKTSE